MRILLVSQMYPGPSAPDLGVFVRRLEEALLARGHEFERAVIDHRGGSPAKYAGLATNAVRAARRFRPEVVYGHFLFPAGAAAALAARAVGARLVVTAHGTDVRNLGRIRGVRAATTLALAKADRVIAVSEYLRGELELKIPSLAGRIEVVDSGVDLERFRPRDAAEARASLGWQGKPPFYLFVGTLDENKNPLRLADAFERSSGGTLAIVGDGPARPKLEGRAGVRLVGRVPPDTVPDWMAASDVLCQPSLVEGFGQALVEALASARSVVATRIGGPPEFVTPDVGALVDPASVESIRAGLEAAAELPRPNMAARGVAEEHDVRRQAEKVERILAGSQ